MNLRRVLSPQVIKNHLVATEKSAAIEELLDLLVATGKVSDRDVALSSLVDRERKMSTGMEHGIAIPHGKTDAVSELIAGVAVSRSGIDFGSLDAKPAHIIVMTLSPRNRTGPHIQFLAEVGQLLRSETTRRAVISAETPEEVLKALTV